MAAQFPFLLFCLRSVTHKVLKLIFKMLKRSAVVFTRFSTIHFVPFCILRSFTISSRCALSPRLCSGRFRDHLMLRFKRTEIECKITIQKKWQIKHYLLAYGDEDTTFAMHGHSYSLLINMVIQEPKHTNNKTFGCASNVLKSKAKPKTCRTTNTLCAIM